MATPLKDRLARSASGSTPLAFDPTGRDEQRLVEIPIDQIDPDPEQPRKHLGDLSELAASIQSHGLLQPIIVVATEDKRYRILAGERRFSACKKAQLEAIPCIVRSVEEQQKLELQIIENIHRKDLNPVEEAESYERLKTQFDYSQRDLAKHVGKSASSINEALRILSLDAAVLDDVRTSEQASKSVLLEIAKEENPKRQMRLWKKAKEGKLTVRVARTSKASESKPAGKGRTVFQVQGGKVAVTLVGEDLSREAIIRVLEEALQKAREEDLNAAAITG